MSKQQPKKDTVPAVQSGDKPSYLAELEKKGAVRSNDNFDSSDITIPRVKLIQALSQEVEDFNDAKPGTLWHTGADKNLGTELDFIIMSRRKRLLLVAPIDDNQGILARADDCIHWVPPVGEFSVKIKGRKDPQIWKLAPTVAESGLDKWGSYNDQDENSPPAATLFYEYLVLLPDHLDLGPVVLSLTRSQIKKAKKGINDKISMHGSAGRPMQALVFHAKSVSEESQAGKYYNFQFSSNGFASEELYKKALEMSGVLSNYKVQDEDKAARDEESAPRVDPSDY